jgi:hypothetical protein
MKLDQKNVATKLKLKPKKISMPELAESYGLAFIDPVDLEKKREEDWLKSQEKIQQEKEKEKRHQNYKWFTEFMNNCFIAKVFSRKIFPDEAIFNQAFEIYHHKMPDLNGWYDESTSLNMQNSAKDEIKLLINNYLREEKNAKIINSISPEDRI